MLATLLVAFLSAAPVCSAADAFCPLVPPAVTVRLGEFTAANTEDVASALDAATQRGGGTLRIVIDSPGGFDSVMFRLIDKATEAQKMGVRIECHVDGMAASAAAIFLEAGCTTRTMTPRSRLLFHECAVTGASGKAVALEGIANEMEDQDMYVATMIAWRIHMSAEQYAAWVHGRDRWVDAPGALKHHMIDAIAP